MHLVIFDIDGTLVDSGDFDGRLYAQAVQEVLGVMIDSNWRHYINVTDSGILDELLAAHQIERNREEIHARVRSSFVRLTRRHIENDAARLREVPGARRFVELLRSHVGYAVAVATGGWRETAELKLRGIGLDPSTVPMATASDASNRREIIKIAADRASGGASPEEKTYFGDGSWDKAAAAELNYDFIAVGNAVAHHRAIVDFSDREAVLAQLNVRHLRATEAEFAEGG